MPPKSATKKNTPKKVSQKKKVKTKSNKKKSPFKVPQDVQDKCQEWILDQRNVPVTEKLFPFEDLPSDEDKIEDEVENPAEYEMSFRQLKREPNSKDQIRMMFECEWLRCKCEFSEEVPYFKHMEIHVQEIKDQVDEEETPYFCKWNLCHYETPDCRSMIRHLYIHAYHTKIKTFGADVCYSVKLPVCKMDSEQRNLIHEANTDFFCHWGDCKEFFISIQQFFDHVKYHVILAYPSGLVIYDKDVDCEWYRCDKKYKQPIHMQSHMLKHTKEKWVACYNCGATFVSKYKLVDHLKRQMEGGYQCPQCFRCFPIEKYLTNHMKAHVNYVKCTLCDMSCVSQSALAKHIRYRHISERPFSCNQCEFKAVTKRDLEIHMNTHDKNFTIRCPVVGCDYICRVISSLRKHDEREHGQIPKIYKCHMCDKAFNYGKRLSKHLITVHEFRYPPGHQRFRYKQDEDGFYKFQEMRLESLEVTEQIILNQEQDDVTQSSVSNWGGPGAEETTQIKRVEDFDVMKRYLRTAKKSNITLEVTDTDDRGNKIKSETFQIDELMVNNDGYYQK